MDNIDGVAVGNGIGHLSEEVASLRLWYTSSCVDVVQKVTILSQLQDKVAMLVCLQQSVNFDDVWMLDVLDDFKLTGKEFAQVLSGGSPLAQDLYCNLRGKGQLLVHYCDTYIVLTVNRMPNAMQHVRRYRYRY